jgi:hypothetical protein
VGIITAGPEDPVELEEGVSVHWEGGGGTDLAAGDRWLFTAAATLYHYQVYGGPFISLSKVYLNDAETSTGVETDPETGAILVRGRSAQVTARVVKDGSAHPVDIIAAILAAVGLQETMDQPSFALAKSLTPEYVIGVCFENISAAQALREILGRCLYDLWLDYGQINLRAYLGE